MGKAKSGRAAKEKKNERKKEKKAKDERKEKMASKAEKTPKIAPMVDNLPQTPSDKLAAIVGTGHVSLRQANQIVWAYIQRNGFQDKEQKHMIRIRVARGTEEPLKDIVGDEPISMFELTEKLRKHLR